MNKIILGHGEIIEKSLDNKIELTSFDKQNFLDVRILKIKILETTDLVIEHTTTNEVKLDIYINLEPNTKCNLTEIKKEGNYKLGYKFYQAENTELNITKVNDVNSVKELLIFNLNGENAKVNYLLKTISKLDEKYDLMVYHNFPNTESTITNHGVNIKEGSLKFAVSGFVPKDKINCVLNQNNRIINLTNNNCEIHPNLFIDENDVIANHSAHIGKCKDDEMFYLKSRGINEKAAESLLIKGFLMQKLPDHTEMEKIIEKYWRWKNEPWRFQNIRYWHYLLW